MTIPHSNLLVAAEAHRDWAVALLESLVRLESPSGDLDALARCGAAIAGEMTALGARVTTHATPAGDHLRGEWGSAPSQLLLLGHYDTVWPVSQLTRMPLRRDVDRLYGPGAFDMKGGIVVALLALRVLAELHARPPHRIVMLWTTDEEVGSQTSRALIEKEARHSRAVLVLEPLCDRLRRTRDIAAHPPLDELEHGRSGEIAMKLFDQHERGRGTRRLEGALGAHGGSPVPHDVHRVAGDRERTFDPRGGEIWRGMPAGFIGWAMGHRGFRGRDRGCRPRAFDRERAGHDGIA